MIYQPSMLGLEQGGLAETMENVLSCYPAHIQQELANVRQQGIEQITTLHFVNRMYL